MNGNWRPLPDPLPAEVAYLVGLLRQYKDRSGLSLAALADRTTFSKSSWERYLNGRTLPRRQAVLALAQLAGEPAERPLALWERAQTAWSCRDAEPAAPATEPVEERDRDAAVASDHRRRWRELVLASVAACVAVVVFVAVAHTVGLVGAAVPSSPYPSTVGCPDTPGPAQPPEPVTRISVAPHPAAR
jgi:transcriptional regulator with XRE-family HTH domain